MKSRDTVLAELQFFLSADISTLIIIPYLDICTCECHPMDKQVVDCHAKVCAQDNCSQCSNCNKSRCNSCLENHQNGKTTNYCVCDHHPGYVCNCGCQTRKCWDQTEKCTGCKRDVVCKLIPDFANDQWYCKNCALYNYYCSHCRKKFKNQELTRCSSCKKRSCKDCIVKCSTCEMFLCRFEIDLYAATCHYCGKRSCKKTCLVYNNFSHYVCKEHSQCYKKNQEFKKRRLPICYS